MRTTGFQARGHEGEKRYTITLLEKWNGESARNPNAVHFCSSICQTPPRGAPSFLCRLIPSGSFSCHLAPAAPSDSAVTENLADVIIEIKRCRRTALGAREYRTTSLIVPLTYPDLVALTLLARLSEVASAKPRFNWKLTLWPSKIENPRPTIGSSRRTTLPRARTRAIGCLFDRELSGRPRVVGQQVRLQDPGSCGGFVYHHPERSDTIRSRCRTR